MGAAGGEAAAAKSADKSAIGVDAGRGDAAGCGQGIGDAAVKTAPGVVEIVREGSRVKKVQEQQLQHLVVLR